MPVAQPFILELPPSADAKRCGGLFRIRPCGIARGLKTQTRGVERFIRIRGQIGIRPSDRRRYDMHRSDGRV